LKIRGRLLVSWQTFTAVGILLGASANLIFHDSWRLQISSSYIPAVPLLFLASVCSESPRWLVKKGRYVDAFAVLKGLRRTKLQAARELYYIHAQLRVENLLLSKRTDVERELSGPSNDNDYIEEIGKFSYLKRVVQLFTIANIRRASMASCTVMASQ